MHASGLLPCFHVAHHCAVWHSHDFCGAVIGVLTAPEAVIVARLQPCLLLYFILRRWSWMADNYGIVRARVICLLYPTGVCCAQQARRTRTHSTVSESTVVPLPLLRQASVGLPFSEYTQDSAVTVVTAAVVVMFNNNVSSMHDGADTRNDQLFILVPHYRY